MIVRRFAAVPAALLVLLPWTASAQRPASARDAFWSASDLITVTPNPAAHPHTKAHARPNTQPHTQPTETASTENESAQPRAHNAVLLVSENGYGAAPHLVRSAENRLGLRCSVLLRNAADQYVEVAPGSVFHSGDHIRLSFLANEPGYFYVIQQGSSGAWSPIFPPPGAPDDANKIEAGQLQVVPSGSRAFAFDQHPGDEKLYVILSRTPIEDIDRAIQNLKHGNQPAPPAAPVEHPQPANAPQMLEAMNVIPDAFVQDLASRDLTLVDEQKVDDTASDGQSGEKAIYVVSKANAGQSASQVVLSLHLRHE